MPYLVYSVFLIVPSALVGVQVGHTGPVEGSGKCIPVCVLPHSNSVSYLLRNSVGSIKALWEGLLKGGGGGSVCKSGRNTH